MDLKIFPKTLQGNICAIPSKSQAHRLLICAAFSSTPTELVCPISNEDIDDIVCTALEGGIGYWCYRAEVVGEYLGEYASDQISRGGTLKLHDAESDDVWSLDKTKLLNGISLAITNGFLLEYEWAKFENEIITIDTCQIDAEVADAIIQYALFDELVFG